MANPENRKELKPTWIPRLVPVGGIIVLLALLIPMLREKRDTGEAARVEPPLAMKVYATGDDRVDSLLAEGLKAFSNKYYDEAARLLAEGHFYLSVKIREGEAAAFPADLRFYAGLAEFYRGRPDRAVPFLEDEARENEFDDKYPWYLAHVYASQGAGEKARAELQKVVSLGGPLADEARKKLAGMSPGAGGAPSE